MNIWTRINSDTYLRTSPSETAQIIGRMYHTYGAKILELGDEYTLVFSPDWNCEGYVETANLKKGDE